MLALRAQDLADLAEQRVDVVADAALAELAEAGEVAPDLRRVDVRVVRDLLRGDPLLAHLLRLRQHLQVPAQARRDADRQPLRHTTSLLVRVLVTAPDILPTASRPASGTVSRRRSRSRSRSASGSTKYVNARSPSISTTGSHSRYSRLELADRRRCRPRRARTSLGAQTSRERPRARARRGGSRGRGRRRPAAATGRGRASRSPRRRAARASPYAAIRMLVPSARRGVPRLLEGARDDVVQLRVDLAPPSRSTPGGPAPTRSRRRRRRRRWRARPGGRGRRGPRGSRRRPA